MYELIKFPTIPAIILFFLGICVLRYALKFILANNKLDAIVGISYMFFFGHMMAIVFDCREMPVIFIVASMSRFVGIAYFSLSVFCLISESFIMANESISPDEFQMFSDGFQTFSVGAIWGIALFILSCVLFMFC